MSASGGIADFQPDPDLSGVFAEEREPAPEPAPVQFSSED